MGNGLKGNLIDEYPIGALIFIFFTWFIAYKNVAKCQIIIHSFRVFWVNSPHLRKHFDRLGCLLFGDKGLKLVTRIKSFMKNKLMPLNERILLRKRSLIEALNGVIKCDF